MKSNGWSEGTAALQLFAHLDGEALNAALLMPVAERDKWEDLSNGFSEYYNSPGRLAVFRGQFESTSRRPEVDPATFAMELGILAVRGFGDMVKDKFIAAQRNCRLRRQLDFGFFGCFYPGYCRQLPSVEESFGAGIELGCWSGPGFSGRVRRVSECRMSQDDVAEASGVFGNGLASSSVRDWCGFGECGDSAEGGEGGWSVGSLGSHILAGSTTVTNGTGGSMDGRKGSFGGEIESIVSFGGEIESIVSRVAGTWHGKRPLGVVEVVGSAAPWFLTGWGNDMEVEFMIDTGCQVTILATSVFERMCAADRQVRFRQRPCGRRLVSADSSWLTVKGELELNVMTVMFQIISTLTLEVPSFLKGIAGLRGVSPNVQLYSEPWGHVDHSNVNCACLSSDQTAAYVHDLALMPRERLPAAEVENASVHTGESGVRMCHAYCLGVGRPGSVPFVSDRSGAYGCLLLAVYVRWKTGLLVSSYLLRPVTRGGGGWRVGIHDPVRGLVDVS